MLHVCVVTTLFSVHGHSGILGTSSTTLTLTLNTSAEWVLSVILMGCHFFFSLFFFPEVPRRNYITGRTRNSLDSFEQKVEEKKRHSSRMIKPTCFNFTQKEKEI